MCEQKVGLIKEFVLSKDVKNYWKANRFNISDFALAGIIWNENYFSWKRRLLGLKELASITENRKLIRQIAERIELEEKALQLFFKNYNNKYIYEVSDMECVYGRFITSTSAIEYAKGMIDKTENRYWIRKHFLFGSAVSHKVRSSMRWNDNGNMKEGVPEEYEGQCIAEVQIGKLGEILYFWSNELKIEDELNCFDRDRFENKFSEIPFDQSIFCKGTPVKHLRNGEYGVISTSKEEWKRFSKQVKGELQVDYYDMSLTVYFLHQDGCWRHKHINPIHLEVALPHKDHLMCRAVSSLNEYWSGDNSAERRVIQNSREYADQFKKPNRFADHVKSLVDIMF